MEYSAAIETLYALNVGVVGSGVTRHERPHKPLLLLAVLDALAAGEARPDYVEWSARLRNRFRAYFDVVKSHDDECTPENPFYYLKTDGFWLPVRRTTEGESPLTTTPAARDLDTGRVFASFYDGWKVLVADPTRRMGFRDALVSRYFPHARKGIGSLFQEEFTKVVPVHSESDDDLIEQAIPGRSAGFRRKVVEIYDYQCAACGLRIWMPIHRLSFVDAAHLVPFSEGRNDHPTNGVALCKNHHWALDQRLIAPNPDGLWSVSRHIEPRRSPGEEELSRLAGKPLLKPSEPVFAPDPSNLKWRFERLLN